MKYGKPLRVAAFALSCLAAGQAWSQDRGVYVGGAFGRADYADACEGVTTTCDKTDKAWKLFGGYQLNRNLAAELAYTDFGDVVARGTIGGAAVDASLQSKAWELSGVGLLPVSREISLFAKLGVYYATTDSQASAAVPNFSSAGSRSDSNTDFTFGAGVRVFITRNLGIQAEWQRYNDVGGDSTGTSDIDMLSAGILFRF